MGGINFIIFSASNFKCTTGSSLVLFVVFCYIFLCILCIGIVLVIDIILSIPKIVKCKCKDIFFKDDPFMFRIQQLVGLGSVFVIIILGIIGIATPMIISIAI